MMRYGHLPSVSILPLLSAYTEDVLTSTELPPDPYRAAARDGRKVALFAAEGAERIS